MTFTLEAERALTAAGAAYVAHLRKLIEAKYKGSFRAVNADDVQAAIIEKIKKEILHR